MLTATSAIAYVRRTLPRATILDVRRDTSDHEAGTVYQVAFLLPDSPREERFTVWLEPHNGERVLYGEF